MCTWSQAGPANDQRLSRRPTEGRPVGSKRRLGRQPLPPEAHPAIRPTPPPAPRWPARPAQGRKTSHPSSAEFQRGLRLGLPTACGFPAAWGIAKSADRPDGPPVPAVCFTVRYPTSPHPPLGLSPKRTEHFWTASRPTGALFPQRPLTEQPPASFPPRAREPRPLPKRTPRSLPTDPRNDHSPTTGRSATPTPDSLPERAPRSILTPGQG